MEGGLLFFIWMTSTRSMIFKDWNKFILFTALIPLVRPEAIIISGLLYFAAVLFYRKESIRPIFISSFLMFSFLGAYSMYCNRINGKYFSNPFYLKSRGNYFNSVNLEQGYEILIADSYAGEISFYIAIIFSIYYIIKHVKKDLLQLFLLFISIGIIYFLGVIITRPINVSGYYWTRYLEPASVSVSLAGCLSFAILFKSLIFKIRKPSELKTILNIIKKITIFLLFLLFAIETIIEIQLIKERMDRLESDCKTIHNLNVSAGLWIHEHANKDEKIAVNDAGAIRFLSDIYTVDLIGLNESSIVRGEKTQLELMRKFSPTWVIIFPDWFSDKSLFGNYKEVKYFEVPEQEYTLCNCPGQRKKVIYRKIE
jgi:hypothetical protein